MINVKPMKMDDYEFITLFLKNGETLRFENVTDFRIQKQIDPVAHVVTMCAARFNYISNSQKVKCNAEFN